MELFLTSSPFRNIGGAVFQTNGLLARLQALPKGLRGLFVASSPAELMLTRRFALEVKGGLTREAMRFASYEWLDDRNAKEAADLVSHSDFLILAGGHVPTQNAFFHRIGLKDLLQGYEGTVLGISAGSMNAAEVVYAQPEEEGEALDPSYQRFLPGLALTKWQILPHYDLQKDEVLDGLRVYEDIAYPDSMGRRFLVLPDGSYLYARDGKERVCGLSWLLQDGKMSLLCQEGEEKEL